MSYILDALRRANSERERGTVPTLHTDTGPADRAQDDDLEGGTSTGLSQRTRRRAGIAAALLLLALGAVWLWPTSEMPALVPVAEAPRPLPPQVPTQQPAQRQMPAPATNRWTTRIFLRCMRAGAQREILW